MMQNKYEIVIRRVINGYTIDDAYDPTRDPEQKHLERPNHTQVAQTPKDLAQQVKEWAEKGQHHTTAPNPNPMQEQNDE